jgi:hypothetical protein
MLTQEQSEILARFREFEHEEAAYAENEDAAVEACRTLIIACCKSPKSADWSSVQRALEQALEAFDLPDDFPQQVFTALAAEATDEEEARRRFPRAAWQQEVASGKTEFGYEDWLEHKRGAGRRE